MSTSLASELFLILATIFVAGHLLCKIISIRQHQRWLQHLEHLHVHQHQLQHQYEPIPAQKPLLLDPPKPRKSGLLSSAYSQHAVPPRSTTPVPPLAPTMPSTPVPHSLSQAPGGPSLIIRGR
jgi:hypothetical protein